MIIFLILFVSYFLVVSYMLYRNHWVYTIRRKLNEDWYDEKMKEIHNGIIPNRDWYTDYYLSYHQMMLKFWCWNVEEMKK
jgi:hypothetical protein